MCASPAPPASGRTAKLPPMPVRKHQEGGIEDLTWLKHFPSTQRALQLDVEDDAGAQQPNTRALQLDCKAALPSLSVMLSAAWAGQASLQSVNSWLFWSAVVKRDHAGKRPFEPDLRGQEFIKMLQCT